MFCIFVIFSFPTDGIFWGAPDRCLMAGEVETRGDLAETALVMPPQDFQVTPVGCSGLRPIQQSCEKDCLMNKKVVRAINALLLHRLVRLGDPDAAIAGFVTLGFPNCFGALDGTHIPIRAPEHSGGRYLNRKGYHSVVLQALVDSRGRFLDIYVGWPGSTHDARVFRKSGLCRRLEVGTYIPQREIPVGGHHYAPLRHCRCGVPPPALAHAPVHRPRVSQPGALQPAPEPRAPGGGVHIWPPQRALEVSPHPP
ncbi:uncharacterized protein LOC142001060 isoform X2 [Carettochelys insculpta]|uniref:uncharacterized protein LOC142001060 isoform X2 n=1 Tax=Carettochelys insculpta TaxID=44489 RepID=UPI003EB8B553